MIAGRLVLEGVRQLLKNQSDCCQVAFGSVRLAEDVVVYSLHLQADVGVNAI